MSGSHDRGKDGDERRVLIDSHLAELRYGVFSWMWAGRVEACPVSADVA